MDGTNKKIETNTELWYSADHYITAADSDAKKIQLNLVIMEFVPNKYNVMKYSQNGMSSEGFSKEIPTFLIKMIMS